MKASLQVRLSQHLALTPQLQQSIRLLQLSTLELHQEIEQMMEQNPFLEPEEETGLPETQFESLNASTSASATRQRQDPRRTPTPTAAPPTTTSTSPPGVDAAEFGTTERDDWENGTERDDFDGIRELPTSSGSGSSGDNDDDFERQNRDVALISLEDHLRTQLSSLRLSDEDAAAVLVLIESLNEDGYLADALDEIAERLAEVLGVEGDDEREELLDRLQCGLNFLQSMEPTGVGARSLGECLCLQLRQKPPPKSTAMTLLAALKICTEHLALLARRDFKKIAQLIEMDEATVRAAQGLIVALEPKPGRPFARAEEQIIIPDVIVMKVARQWRAVLNPDVMPKLRVNDLYAQAIKSQRASGSALTARLQEARWFIRNIQQRFDTILRVSQAIIERQKNFFSHGAIAMKPLVLREIADELGLHESHHLARDHRQVHGHAVRHLRAQVLLRLVAEHRRRRQRVVDRRARADQAAGGRREPGQAAVRQPARRAARRPGHPGGAPHRGQVS